MTHILLKNKTAWEDLRCLEKNTVRGQLVKKKIKKVSPNNCPCLQTYTHAPTHTHMHTRACTHAHARKYTYMRTHNCNVELHEKITLAVSSEVSNKE